MTRHNPGSGAVLGGSPRRKSAAAVAADLYATNSGFRFLTNFVFFGWLTLLCLAFSSNLGPHAGAAPFSLGLPSAFAAAPAAPSAPGNKAPSPPAGLRRRRSSA